MLAVGINLHDVYGIDLCLFLVWRDEPIYPIDVAVRENHENPPCHFTNIRFLFSALDGSHVCTRRLSQDNLQRREAWKETSVGSPLVEGGYQVP
jgi:hypothetical protein